MVCLPGLGIVAVFPVVFVFHLPGPEIVFASACTEEIMDAACYLESRGGEVSFKNLDVSRLIPSAHDTANPSLHVMRPQERHLAARLVSEWERARNAGGEPIF